MKTCAICTHVERGYIDKLLEQGLAPRSLARRIGGTTRNRLAHHRDVCLKRNQTDKEV